MKTKLSLQEKLRDLREEKKLRLVDVYEATGIPTTTLQRFESDENTRVGYQEVEVLTRFYGVSADYLFGLTDHRKYRNVKIDKLRLSDDAVSVLTSGKLNNRLLSELISNDNFPELLAALEVFIDGTVINNINVINASYKVAIDKVTKEYKSFTRDEYLAKLNELIIDPNEYLLFRLSERFDIIAQSLYDAHKKENVANTDNGIFSKY